jgi:hypothetical protein
MVCPVVTVANAEAQLHGPADFTVSGLPGAAEVILGKPPA